MISRERLRELMARELADFASRNPRSERAYADAEHLFGITECLE